MIPMTTQVRLFGQIVERRAGWSRWAVAAAAYALVVGAVSVAQALPDALGGESAASVRVILGLIGLVAGLVLWLLPRYELLGWRIAVVWALAQIPVIAWNEYGSATHQCFEIAIGISSRSTHNGVVTSASQLGVNLLAFVLLGIYEAQKRRLVG
jgi:hypothetical protein